MIFPIGDDNVRGGSKPILSYAFITLNVIIFFYQITLDPELLKAFIFNYGSIPKEILDGEDYYTIITSMFLHGGLMHLAGNMIFLWVFADNIEAVVGNIRFLVFYLFGGIAATACHIAFNVNSPIPSVGASGAISAVMGAYLIMFPKSRIKVFFFFRIIYLTAIIFLGLWIGQQLLAGLASVGPETAHTAGVAWWAHIGGFVFGVLGGLVFRKWGFMEGVYHNTGEKV